MAAPAAQFAATRDATNSLVLYLSPTQPPIPIPPELRDELPDQIWAERLRTLTATASRYNKVWFERIWLLVGICAIFIVPVALFPIILKALLTRNDTVANHIFEARGISFGVFVGLMLLFFVPMAIWKYIGQQEANALLLKTPGIFSSNIILRIQLPAGKSVSVFTFGAYLPSHIGQAPDQEANYFYPYKPGSEGLPRMSTIGNVPLFNDEKKGEQEPPPKLTKTALKKAAKAARQAKAKPTPPQTPPVAPASLIPDIVSEEVEPLQPPVLTNGIQKSEPEAPLKVEEFIPDPVIPPTPLPPVEIPLPTLRPPLPEPVVPNPTPTVAKPSPVVAKPIPVVVENPTLVAETTKKRQNMLTRTLWTFIMIGAFIALLLMGHTYMILLVMLCQTLVYREVTALFSLTTSEEETKKHGKDPWSTTLNWYFFVVTNYFLFTLYTIGFVGFVMSLQKGFLKQQFGLFCWVHMSLLIIVLSSHFIVNNILEGLIWFWVPASLVICNDVFAYVWGITFGRTPLIQLSPKKTVEGFIGAFWSTMIFGVLWGTYFMQFDYMICPVQDLGVSAWSSVKCKPNPVFVWRDWQMGPPMAVFLSTLLGRTITTIPYAPYHLHLLFMSGFASLVAPFGGFFASGFKRAFNIKDFGHSIPGHGGMTDRMDCQFLMGVFVYVYYGSLIREYHVTVGSVLQTIATGLTVDEQLVLLADLQRYLARQGIKIPSR
ncbi:Phosphatidate cytidylyltransferase [Mycena indigotica]|uniref:Phosphatidate cytidylyltransferase n=1 Tax=Mycena indigotica TaxID=2126181 RepID=A0A8H6TH27_9AGAR|nr:Phosphatidate cytidylyltransferase [Mycena indigotica]KAF7315625.1 Phosphatidate cytidylyltransferase [Mycena indigotica]